MSSESTILVTGATGNTGSEVIKALTARKIRPRAAIRNIEKAHQIFGSEIDLVEFDFVKPTTFESALHNIDKVFLIRPPKISNIKRDLKPFIDAMNMAGVKRVVFLSLLGAEKNRFVPHHAIEQLLMESNLGWTFLRAGFFMQNLSTVHRDEIRNDCEISVPAGKGKTSFVDCRDIAAVAAKALFESGLEHKAPALTGGSALDYFAVAEVFSRILGKPVCYTNPSVIRFFLNKIKDRTSPGFALIMSAIYLTTRFGLAESITNDIQEILGRNPIDLQTFIEDHRRVWI